MTTTQNQNQNHIIGRLPKAQQKRFLDRCDDFELVLSADLSVRDKPLTHAYFPVTGFVSLVVDIESHPPLEVGMVGREAMVGSELVLGVAKTPWRSVVQGGGRCWRIEASALRESMEDIPLLKSLVQRTLMIRLHQQALASACERFHPIDQRLARWLLMMQDRAESSHFRVTQEFVALMLGVRRVGVTQAAHEFQKAGLIEYHRGELDVIDRLGLEKSACSCFEADKLLHDTLMDAKT